MKLKLRNLSRWPSSLLLSVGTVVTLTSLLLLIITQSAQSIRIREGGSSSRDPYEEDSPPQIYRRRPAGPLQHQQQHQQQQQHEEGATSPPSPTDLLLHYYGQSVVPSLGGRSPQYQLKPKPKTVILARPTYRQQQQQQQQPPVPVLSSRDQDENDDDEVEDETDYNYYGGGGGGGGGRGGQDFAAETTTPNSRTILVHQIPQALRRNFAHVPLRSSSSSERGVTTTLDTPIEVNTLLDLDELLPSPSPTPVKSSRKKNKTKNSSSSSSSSSSHGGGRRRKVKRPVKTKDVATASALKSTAAAAVGSATDGDLEDEKPPSSSGSASNSTGEKNLALEIGSDDGKYALIDSFFNQTEVQQPGIISYRPSEDFADKDNEKTLGNLNQNEIWLSDGHLLVLKGGEFDGSNKEVWPPIDNFQRKKKPPPLKIPLDTDNPPPFPVFVNDSGPPIFLREPPPFLAYPPPGFLGNDSNFDPSLLPPPGLIPLNPNGTIPQGLPFPPPGGFGGPLSRPPGGGGGLYNNNGPPPGGLYGGGGNPPSGGVNSNGGFGVNQGVYGQGGHKNNNRLPPPGSNNGGPPPPFYPFLPPPGQGNNNGGGNNNNNGQNFPPPPPQGYNQNFNGTGGPPQGFPFLPPLVLNPADNETDDPSIFLPPPYDFDYYEDNSTLVPPGPFAPGLVVPPPKDFYSVYNRTGRPPPLSTVTSTFHFFPTTAIPSTVQSVVTSPVSKKQRPNAKKPKFPITNPPDDSLEELYSPHLVTTPIPPSESPLTTTTKKRKQQRPKSKKPFFPVEGGGGGGISGGYEGGGKFNSQEFSGEDIIETTQPPPPPPPPQHSTPSIIFPSYKNTQYFNTSPRPNIILSTVYPPTGIIPTGPYRAKSAPPPPSTTSTTTTTTTTTTASISSSTTPKPILNSFVYVQGRLTTLEEIAAAQAAEDFDSHQLNHHNGPTTPRPPFDSRGYPTRVIDDNAGGPIIFEFPKQKNGRKPITETPLKTYYVGTPKYEPNYGLTSPNQGGNIQYGNQGPIIIQQQQGAGGQGGGSPIVQSQQPPTILYPSTVYSTTTTTNGENGYPGGRGSRVRNRNRNNQNVQRLNQNQGNNHHHHQNLPIYIANDPQNGYYGNGNLLNIGPTYVTQTQPQQQQQPQNQQQQEEQPQINFVEKAIINPYNHNSNSNNNNNRRPSVIIQSNPPNYLRPNTQILTNSGGFRPALPPPQQPQQQLTYNNNQQQQQRPHHRARVLFPGQVSLQQLQQQQFNQEDLSRIPVYSHRAPGTSLDQSQDVGDEVVVDQRVRPNKAPRPTLKTFAPQGYYSPITNYQVDPTPTFGTPFVPSQYYGGGSSQQNNNNNNNRNGQQQQYNYPAPVSVSNFQSDPTIPSTNYNIHSDTLQVYQPNYQQQHQQPQTSNGHNNQQRAFSPQRLNTQQFIQPLYDDLRINYREPIPPYNEESESVTTRSVLKAGPGQIGDKATAGSAPGTFYSFQRGGVGGFSYKIRL